MTNDRYLKAVLTVIAAALTIIAGQQVFQTAWAQGSTCGTTNPCKTVNVYWDDSSFEWKTCDRSDRACYFVALKK